jgi:4-alpha-glucanotransferase
MALKKYCKSKGVQIIGDLPIYVTRDGADVWSNPEIFKLDENLNPTVVAGVPPDYFSTTGQLWGNPVYDWKTLQQTGFKWWMRRIERMLTIFDIVRIDHFRGLVAYWEVPATAKTAVNGKWIKVPIHEFIKYLQKRFFNLPIIAEDLGYITADVREVLSQYNLPGMKILQFAFGEDNPGHPYLPHNYTTKYVVYTGTHDNNTVVGWMEKEATKNILNRLQQYTGKEVQRETIHLDFIRLAMMSVADMCIVPIQDILGLGSDARFNTPGTAQGNWEWRLSPDMLTPDVEKQLYHLTSIYGRI